MGLFDFLKPQQTTPVVPSILPNLAKQEILNGRLPNINVNRLLLKKDEFCHYAEKAIYEKKTTRKKYIRRNNGYSMPGLFKGTRIHLGGGTTNVSEDLEYSTIRGYLYITNKRVIFLSNDIGFETKVADLTAITPYSNCIELQTKKEIYRVFVPDGEIVNIVLQLIYS